MRSRRKRVDSLKRPAQRGERSRNFVAAGCVSGLRKRPVPGLSEDGGGRSSCSASSRSPPTSSSSATAWAPAAAAGRSPGGLFADGRHSYWTEPAGVPRPTGVSTDSGGPGARWGPVGATRGGRPQQRRGLRGRGPRAPSAASSSSADRWGLREFTENRGPRPPKLPHASPTPCGNPA